MTDVDGIQVNTGTLVAQAKIWDTESERMRQLSSTVAGLSLDHVQAGVFFVIVDAYDRIVEKVTGLCGTGQYGAATEMEAIANGLRSDAAAYTEAERKNTAMIQHLNHLNHLNHMKQQQH
ncbi:MAG: hypothetical protein J2P25_00650 [Nocardiopsaceae bacterium]|nr:hypothetical protein [Nocardiopsaceae bacterium]